jgi:hypothetical protein
MTGKEGEKTAYSILSPTVTCMKLLQSALWAATVAVPRRVPVTALAQLSALHPVVVQRFSAMPLRAVPTRARRTNAVFMMENRRRESNAFYIIAIVVIEWVLGQS